jgi:hypothetical protein
MGRSLNLGASSASTRVILSVACSTSYLTAS